MPFNKEAKPNRWRLKLISMDELCLLYNQMSLKNLIKLCSAWNIGQSFAMFVFAWTVL